MDYTYEMFEHGINDIVEQIDNDCHNDYDYIIGLTRGGLIPAVFLSHRLDVPMLALNWQTRDSNLREMPHNFKTLINNKKVLIVDDIIDSGETFELLIKEITGKCSHFEIACLIFNEEQKIDCNYKHVTIRRSIDPSWVNFFWEE